MENSCMSLGLCMDRDVGYWRRGAAAQPVGAGGPGPVAHVRDGPPVPAGLSRGHAIDVLRPAVREIVREVGGVVHPVEALEVQVRAGGFGERLRLGGVSGYGGDSSGGGKNGSCGGGERATGHHASKISAT